MRLLFSAIAIVFFAGCATPAHKKYEGVSFDSFIDSLPYKEHNDTQRKWAYRVKLLQNEDKYRSALKASFNDWCKAQGGIIGASEIRNDIYRLKNVGYEYPKAHYSEACLDSNKLSQWVYVQFEDATVAFYTDAQAPVIHAEVDRVSKERQTEYEAKRKRKDECHAEKIRIIRTSTRPGMLTNYGMVVDVKPPLAQLQVLGANGPTLQWVEIGRLAPPYGEYCN